MAEGETTIPLDRGSESSSTQVGLESTHASESSEGVPAEGTNNVVVQELREENVRLKASSDQYLRERGGWEAQSRRNLEENAVLVDRNTRLEAQVHAATAVSQDPPRSESAPALQLGAAVQLAYDQGDTSGLDRIEQVLLQRPKESPVQPQPEDMEKIIDARVDARLVNLGTKSNAQAAIGTRHVDMQDIQSPLYAAVYEQIDGYASESDNQLLFPADPRYAIPMSGPQGGQKIVDARLVDRLAAEVRLQGGIQEGRQQELRASTAGTTQTGRGRQSSSPAARTVEASNLLTQGERDLLSDPKVRKGWPEIPADPKAAAKFLYDILSPEEQAKRLATHNQQVRTGV